MSATSQCERCGNSVPAGSVLNGQCPRCLLNAGLEEAPSLPQSTQTPLIPGAQLGRYQIVELLGSGGMGKVYKARDPLLGRAVAIKVQTEQLSGRFELEAQAISALNHPHICTVYDVGPNYLVMELVEGETIAARLRRAPLPMTLVVQFGAQIADAVAAAHALGVIHRDLKPANIMVARAGIKVLDFGLAKFTWSADAPAPSPDVLTTSEGIMGTLAYMSPEQARAEELDGRSDLFSFGVVLYEMATGVLPFRGESPSVVFKAILDGTPTPAIKLNPGLPAELERILDKALEKDRDLRYQSAAEMRSDLQRLQQDSESHKSIAVTSVRPSATGKRLTWIAGATLLLMVIAGSVYFIQHRSPAALTDRDTVVLADFANATGDPVFDGTLRQGLSAQLEQSPFLNLLSDQRIAQTLALMAQPKDARLTQELGREVCLRTASTATIEGSISSLGSQYVLGLNAVNCRNGDLLAQEQVTANGKEQVLKALGDATRRLRERLGESLASVQKYAAPPENVTTPSLEALHAYSLGYQTLVVNNDSAGALPFFQRAANLDTNFAMAHLRVANSYGNLGESTRAAESMRKAYELRLRTGEREKLSISSSYESMVVGNLRAAGVAFELWAQTYPRDEEPRLSLGSIYTDLGEHEKALTAVLECLRLNPTNGITQGGLVAMYLYMNRFAEAKAAAREARAHNLDSPYIHQFLYSVNFLQQDAAGMEFEAAGVMGKPGYEDAMLFLESNTAAYGGRFANARELTRRAAESAQRADEIETAAGYQANAGVHEACVGNTAWAKQAAETALTLARGKYVEANSALALGLAGDSARAARLAADLGKRFPEDTLVQFQYLPLIHAAVALRHRDARKAVEVLAAAEPYELGGEFVSLYPAYLRGEAYLAARQGAAAEVEFQKILDHPGVVGNDPIGALAHLGLGRAYALDSDSAKAKIAYREFLALWKNADPEVPILQQAKTEYAKLK